MKLSELIKALQDIQSDIGSHPSLDDSLIFICDDDKHDDSFYLDIASVEPDTSMGCGCWIGAKINLSINDPIWQREYEIVNLPKDFHDMM
jgi:hypothetical protein